MLRSHMTFLLKLNGHALMQPDSLGVQVYANQHGDYMIEAISTMNLVGYLSQYPSVRFIDSRPVVIEVIQWEP